MDQWATIGVRYVEACKTPSDVFEHLPVFVQMVYDLNAQKVIELGTRSAVSTVAWLHGLEETSGHLWSVDLEPAPPLPSDRWTFIQGDDLDPHVVKQLPSDADIVFIDTSHMYADTLAELNVYRWQVKAGGKIVLHDTELACPIGWTRQQPRYPVKAAVEQFCMDENLTVEYLPNCFGLGIVEVT